MEFYSFKLKKKNYLCILVRAPKEIMNIERFHNELAMQLGYERIVNDKRILISVEDSDSPWVTLKVRGHDDICFKASDCATDIKIISIPEMQNEIRTIIDAVYKAYFKSSSDTFTCFVNRISENASKI